MATTTASTAVSVLAFCSKPFHQSATRLNGISLFSRDFARKRRVPGILHADPDVPLEAQFLHQGLQRGPRFPNGVPEGVSAYQDATARVRVGVAGVNADAGKAGDIHQERQGPGKPLRVGDDDLVPARGDGRLAGDLLGALDILQSKAKTLPVDQQFSNRAMLLGPTADEPEIHPALPPFFSRRWVRKLKIADVPAPSVALMLRLRMANSRSSMAVTRRVTSPTWLWRTAMCWLCWA